MCGLQATGRRWHLCRAIPKQQQDGQGGVGPCTRGGLRRSVRRAGSGGLVERAGYAKGEERRIERRIEVVKQARAAADGLRTTRVQAATF